MLELAKKLSAIEERKADFARQVHVDAALFLAFLAHIGQVERWKIVQILNSYIERTAAQVVIVDHSQLGRKAKQQLSACFFIGHERENTLRRVFLHRTCELLQQSSLLFVKVCHHNTQLFAVFRHVVGFSTRQLIAAFTYFIDLRSNQFGHLGLCSCRQNICIHKVMRVKWGRFGGRNERLGRLGSASDGVHSQQNAIVIAAQTDDTVLLIYQSHVLFRRIGHTDRPCLNADDAIRGARLH